MGLIAGIDCGTQGTKVILIDAQSKEIIGEKSAPHQLVSGANGKREQQPQWWIDAMLSAFKELIATTGVNPQDIDAIGVSGQQHGLVALDKNGVVIRDCKLWCDTETAAENAEFLELLGGEKGSIEKLGLRVETGYTASKLLWMAKNEPQNFKEIKHVLLPHDYINYWLTGEYCAEFGDASGTGLFDVRNRCWSIEACNLIDPSGNLYTALPKLVDPKKPIGCLSERAIKALNLRQDVVVAPGGGDNMMGAIGTGNVTDGIVTMSLGTSGTIYTSLSKSYELNQPSIANFCSSSNGWLPLICTMNVTSATTQVQKFLDLDLTEFNQQLDAAPIGANGLIFLPFFNGERVPALPNSTASIYGLDATNLTGENLVRAVVEGASFGLRYGVDALRSAGIAITQIRLIGGGAKSTLWRQIIADIMQAEVVCLKNSEAGALGAALQAYWVSSDLSLEQIIQDFVKLDNNSKAMPITENVAAYQEVYAKYLAKLNNEYSEALGVNG